MMCNMIRGYYIIPQAHLNHNLFSLLDIAGGDVFEQNGCAVLRCVELWLGTHCVLSTNY